MKIFTEKKKLVKLENIPFSYEAFAALSRFASMAPNIALDAIEIHTGRKIRVKLFELLFDWQTTRDVNIP